MKKLIMLLVSVAGFMLGNIRSGLTYGCPWMSERYQYDDEVYSSGYGTWCRAWRKSTYYEDLSPEQRKELGNLEKKFEKESLPVRKELRAKRLELRALRLKEKPDSKEIAAKKEEIAKAESRLEELSAEYRDEIKKILPEDIREEYLSGWSDYWNWSESGRYCWWMEQ